MREFGRVLSLIMIISLLIPGIMVNIDLGVDFQPIETVGKVCGSFPGGDGTAGNPYQISTIQEFQQIEDNMLANYTLINNINALATPTWNNGMGFKPLGFPENENTQNPTQFQGSLDGNGYTIDGIYIDRTQNKTAGIFMHISGRGSITDLKITNVTIKLGESGGGLAAYNDGSIDNVSISGKISNLGDQYGTNDALGGLLVTNHGRLVDCSVFMDVEGIRDTGGLVMRNSYRGIIERCSFNGTVKGGYYVGGLAAMLWRSTIKDCTVNAVVDSRFDYIGGLVGQVEDGTIKNCHTSGTVFGDDRIGGLVGECIEDRTEVVISNCSSSCRVIESDGHSWRMGGLIGFMNGGLVTDCFTSGNLTGGNQVGGLIGYSYSGHILNSVSRCNITTTHGISGGFLGEKYYDKVVNCTSYGDVIGTSSVGGFAGDGSGFWNCRSFGDVKGTGNGVGGFLGVSGALYNCAVRGNVTGGNSVGGLIGGSGYVNNSSFEGNVVGNIQVGGIAGSSSSMLTGSFSLGTVRGSDRVGGLIGYVSNADIENCYSMSSVNGTSSSGGLVGTTRGGSIVNCYSAGLVECNTDGGGFLGQIDYGPVITSCFWDMTTSGKSNGLGSGSFNGLTGKTTDLMIQKDTFVGWDLSSFWGIVDKKTYPYLRWQIPNAPRIIGNFDTKAFEDRPYENILDSEDPDPTDLECFWYIETNATWITIDKDSGKLYGTPTNDDVGTWAVNITADDGRGANTTITVNLTVINTNDPPMINTTSIPDPIEEVEYSFQLEAIDIDLMDRLTWEIIGTNAEFLALEEETGILSCTPTNYDVGIYWINVGLSDNNGGEDSMNTTFEVRNVNDAPTILPFNVPDLIEDTMFRINIAAEDVDLTKDELVWSIKTNATFTSISNSSGVLYGTPTNDDVGSWDVIINVSDGKGGYDEVSIILTVANTNDPPDCYPDNVTITIDEDQENVMIDLNNYFFDIDGDFIYFDHEDGIHVTATIKNGMAHLLPEEDWNGMDLIVFSASDGEFITYLNVSLNVTYVNDPPENVEIFLEERYRVGEPQMVNSTADDPDLQYGDVLEFIWTAEGLGFIGRGQWANLSLPVGVHLITLTVTDAEGLSSTATREITILPPIVTDDDDDTDDDIIDDDIVDDDSDGDEDGSGKGTSIALIIIIVIVTIIVIGMIVGYLIMKKKRDLEATDKEEEMPQPNMVEERAPPPLPITHAPAGGLPVSRVPVQLQTQSKEVLPPVTSPPSESGPNENPQNDNSLSSNAPDPTTPVQLR